MGNRRLLVLTNGRRLSFATTPAYARGWAVMALIANRSARWLLARLNAAVSGTKPLGGCCHCHAWWFHRYRFGSGRFAGSACARPSGCTPGHSACRSAGGLITVQSANDIVRDHRNSPLLLLMLNEPCAASNQPMYATTGSAPATRPAAARRQPTRWISPCEPAPQTSAR